ncbi:MAG: patatin-like phospholipase family protein [Firmicutes bacterium]|nr:patatin-like phospholipase family protein [Bacillota bacterium]
MKKLGIVLGADGAKAAAQIGFLQVLYDNAIKIDCVAGASSGAIIGGAMAGGMTPAQMWDALRKIKAYHILTCVPNPFKSGLFNTKKVKKLIRGYWKGKQMDELDIKFCCAATDLSTGELVVFDADSKVDMAEAVMASCCVPGIFEAEQINEKQYIDGGLKACLPIDAIRRFNPDVIIALDTSSKTTKPKKFRNFVSSLWQLYVIMEADVHQQRLDEQKPDFVVKVDIEDMSLFEISKFQYAYDKGYEAGLANIEKIKELLK